MRPEESAFAAALATAIAADIREFPPAGALVRVIVRWFTIDKPLYFTVHALGEEERADVDPEDAWYPLEWENLDRELERTGRVHSAVEAAVEPPLYEDLEEEEPSAAILDAIRRLPAAVVAAGVALGPEFAVSAAHFEGWGALEVLRQVAPADVVLALDARGELPRE